MTKVATLTQLQAFARQLNHERLRDQFMEEAQALHWTGHCRRQVETLVKLARSHNRAAIRERRTVQ